ncbi:hypothetical protein K435DRAFT_790807 [Dendrothele bispora CBS 962.96]|uniref:Uncharacterized protein n=1 Tax=Dendrothele bispora (strain CBS 962.96) TaxID=1314807 RepID=A0A4V4HHY6_DENBC|nr:hypothetical protein K435DRAFT_790807 [Dendrothele bispora CBS 962.96]
MTVKKDLTKVSARLRRSSTQSVGSSGNPLDYHPRMRIGLKTTQHPSGCHPNPTQSDPGGHHLWLHTAMINCQKPEVQRYTPGCIPGLEYRREMSAANLPVPTARFLQLVVLVKGFRTPINLRRWRLEKEVEVTRKKRRVQSLMLKKNKGQNAKSMVMKGLGMQQL